MNRMESESVFVDSNFFVALFNPSDTLHKQALLAASRLDDQNIPVILSNFVFLEVVTVLSQKRGKAVAVTCGKYLQTDSKFSIVHVDERLQEHTWELFKSTESKNISFVDCSTVAIMEDEAITKLLTFDKTDFKKLQKHHKFSLFN